VAAADDADPDAYSMPVPQAEQLCNNWFLQEGPCHAAATTATHLLVELLKPGWVKRSTCKLGLTVDDLSLRSCCACCSLRAVDAAAAAAAVAVLLCLFRAGSIILHWLLLLLLLLVPSCAVSLWLLKPSILQ
jgi:hypothetical protein